MTTMRARMAAAARLNGRSCPQCGGTAMVVGGHKTAAGRVVHIACRRCGYVGHHWRQHGVVFDIPTIDGDGRPVTDEAYSARIIAILAENWMKFHEARAAEEDRPIG